MRSTDIEVTFHIPEYAFRILEILRTQNSSLGFTLDDIEKTITLYADMIDFPPYTNDYDNIEDFEDNALEG